MRDNSIEWEILELIVFIGSIVMVFYLVRLILDSIKSIRKSNDRIKETMIKKDDIEKELKKRNLKY
ncbi:hypothetical protein NY404_00240 [Elizabethkingia anophelis]|uniref:hypothetical protein n=1 Tax=Elizabethkingia anophelis TaxID=1117645 RepID=UPI0002ACD29F|nr:hypothetical protein [Elizabethkingia anophelis]ELR81090.1 hypothetical protein D505_00980 [Elizabethkingia anophelis R26]MCS7387347.1 hypothetical protein [Elizabethkingia anophelis]